ncbi:hypothetical protein CAT7_06206 [Carnobacterium sp. AT7]|uniref:hypothetical protein n=1 Tax=Carnobacterium TaxID=2747 RepID=UPI00015F1CA1|nr:MULTISPECIES: hypothetical protein [Carnobacterium]EDP69091.1 hypothetical protein CAT7_06206 [Carnobacterium sp. AT7]
MKKELLITSLAFVIGLTLFIQTLIAQSEARLYLPLFFTIGIGLGLLRLFVNNSIKKMKGKSIGIKILFFAVLLGIGLPFQTWFRTNILFSMDSDILPRSIAMLILGVLCLTFYLSHKKKSLAK